MEETTQSATPETATTPEAPASQPAPDLNINDLVALRNIIDVASQRGSFKAGEMEAIGKTYNKLSAFLEAVGNAKKD